MIDCSKAENYMAEKTRMTKAFESGICRIRCEHCPLDKRNNDTNSSCMELESKYPQKAIQIVQKWSNAHPTKTYLSEFLLHYPDVELDEFGTPKGVCPHHLGLKDIPCKNGCTECWNQSID